MFCYNCGTELPEGSLFCSSCGQSLKEDDIAESSRTDYGEQINEAPVIGAVEQTQDPGQKTYAPPPPYYGQRDGQQPRQHEQHNPHTRNERDVYGFNIPKEYPPFFDRNGWSWPAFWFPVYWYCYKGMYMQAWKFLLVSLVSNLIASIWAGIVGYKEYSEFINSTPPHKVDQKRSTGMGCIITMIVLGLLIFVFYFVGLFAVITSEGIFN